MRHIPAILIFSAILALQLLLIGEVGAGDSEAYYYSWSRNLSLSYYDHPAGIAFLIRISTVIFGHSTFGLRFFSTILINLSLLILYITGNIFYKETKTALIAMLFLISTPAFLIGGVSASPEPPLIFFCSLSLLFFFLFTKTHMTSYLYISFFLSGIGFNIKYSAIFLTAGYFYILIKKNRKLKRELICCAAITLASLLPVILWNLAHKGVSFEYHLIDRVNPLYIPLNILKFAGGQLLYFNPILVIIMISLITREAKGKSENIFKTLFIFLISISSVPMLLIKDSEPHWSSLAYIPAAIFFAEKISEHKKKFISALTLNLLLFGVFIFHLLSPAFTETILKNKDPKYDITNELFGWDSVAENIEYIISSENIPAKEVLLLSNHYTMSGQLMFSTKSKYRVVCRGKRCNQFKIDDIQDESNFRLFIFVTDNRFTEIPPVYREGAIQQKLKVFRGEKRVRDFYLYIKKKINPSDKSAE